MRRVLGNCHAKNMVNIDLIETFCSLTDHIPNVSNRKRLVSKMKNRG